MPFVHLENISEDCCWGMWKIMETPEHLAQRLTEKEDYQIHTLDFLKHISHPVKQCESLAARLVIKEILGYWGISYEGIWKDAMNKPHLINSDFYISISHASTYGVGIVHKKKPVGIDMELVRDKIKRISHKFLSSQELQNTEDNLEKLIILWAGKEALYKLYGKKKLIFNTGMLTESFYLEKKGIVKALLKPLQKSYAIHYQKLEEYYIAYVF